jgi:hypothetical protein
MKLNINNQCLDFKLTNLRSLSRGANWNEEPDEKVDAGAMMSADLISLLSTFEGILAYDLEKKGSKSTYIRLFVVWKSEGYREFRMFVHLTEYEEKCDWSKVGLEEYYQRYASQLCTYTGPIKDTWLIPGGTVLMTEVELDFTQRDGALNIIISGGIEDERTKKPEWINVKR